jgi:hypothetical protein
MKKPFLTQFQNTFIVLMTTALLLSCSQMESFEANDLQAEANEAAKSGFNLTPYGNGLENAKVYTSDVCKTECITTEEETWFVKTLVKEYSASPQGSVTIKIYNTPTQIIYSITSTNDINRVDFKGNIIYASNTPAVQPYVHAVNLGAGWKGCDTEAAKIEVRRQNSSGTGGGQYINFDTSYDLIPVCPPVGCDNESFSYVTTNENLNVVFSYDAASALSAAVVEFTFPQIMNMILGENGKYSAPDGKMYSVNNATNQTVFTWVGDIGCTDATATTFTFNFSPDCGAGNANDGQARIWSDTKVNGVSVKNSNTPNIDYKKCPIF